MWWIVFPIIAFLLAVYLFLAAPALRRIDASSLMGVYYAHRGLYDNASDRPENSLAAFRAAVSHGYGIELDVQMSADGVLFVFHDDSLARICGIDKRICDMNSAEVASTQLFNTQSNIPLFNDVLTAVAGSVPLIIEIKSEKRRYDLAAKVRERLRSYSGAYCIESFDPFIIRWFKKNAPEIIRGQLSTWVVCDPSSPVPAYQRFALGNMLLNFLSRPDFAARDVSKLNNISMAVCRLFSGIVVGWTVKTPADFSRLISKCDLIIFEGFTP